MPRVDRDAVSVLDDAPQAVEVAEVELWVDALAEQVHRDRHDVQVPRALAVPEQRALEAIRARLQSHLRGRDGGAAVVVRMERQDDPVAVADAATEPLDDVRIDVRRIALDGRGQVEDELPRSEERRVGKECRSRWWPDH